MYVQSIQILLNILSITSCSPIYLILVLYATYSYVKYPLHFEGIYGGKALENSIFRPLYVDPYLPDRLERLRGPFWAPSLSIFRKNSFVFLCQNRFRVAPVELRSFQDVDIRILIWGDRE